MKYEILRDKKQVIDKLLSKKTQRVLNNLEDIFDIIYTNDSTAIEGNKLPVETTEEIINGINSASQFIDKEKIFKIINYINQCERFLTENSAKSLIHSIFVDDSFFEASGILGSISNYKKEDVGSLSESEVKKRIDVYEQINHYLAVCFLRRCVESGKKLDEYTIKDIHMILLDGIGSGGGFYRSSDVSLKYLQYTPPRAMIAREYMKDVCVNLYNEKLYRNPIEKAAKISAEIATIQPFSDGNKRTSRIVMNYILMENGLFPISIKNENRNEYINAIEQYGLTSNIEPLAEIIASLENERLDKVINVFQTNKKTNSRS